MPTLDLLIFPGGGGGSTSHLCKVIQVSKQAAVFDTVAGQQSLRFKDFSRCEVCHLNGDSIAFAAGCFLAVTVTPMNRQKAANDFFFLVNSCPMHSASWMHAAGSDVSELTAGVLRKLQLENWLKKILQAELQCWQKLFIFSMLFNVVPPQL